MLPQLLDDGGQRVVKVFVIPAPKAIAGHGDVTAERLLGGIEAHQGGAFGRGEERGSKGVAMLLQRFSNGGPIQAGQPLCNGAIHSLRTPLPALVILSVIFDPTPLA